MFYATGTPFLIPLSKVLFFFYFAHRKNRVSKSGSRKGPCDRWFRVEGEMPPEISNMWSRSCADRRKPFFTHRSLLYTFFSVSSLLPLNLSFLSLLKTRRKNLKKNQIAYMSVLLKSLDAMLACAACGNPLYAPVTLSCGYTVCQQCVPPFSPQLDNRPRSTFLCPVAHCNSRSHLFGPDKATFIDNSVQELCQLLQDINTRPRKKTRNSADGRSISPSPTLSSDDHILECSKCAQIMVKPMTMHCGHAYCRLCALKTKIECEGCVKCPRPLPRYNYLQDQAAVNCLLERAIALYQQDRGSQDTNPSPSISSSSALVPPSAYAQQQQQQQQLLFSKPIFVTGVVILPRQHVRLPVMALNHLRMLRNAVYADSQYHGLCIAAVHRGRPSLSQYGTIVEIVSAEQYSNNSIILDVVGRERFRVQGEYDEATDPVEARRQQQQLRPAGARDIAMLLADIEIVPEYPSAPQTAAGSFPSVLGSAEMSAATESHGSSVFSMSEKVHAYIMQLARTPPLAMNATGVSATLSLSTSTEGLMGPLWFETMQGIHGRLPPASQPAGVCWWAAGVLPVSGAERYALLRTLHLSDRLALVWSWIKQLDTQWKRCRQTAITSVNQVFQQQQN